MRNYNPHPQRFVRFLTILLFTVIFISHGSESLLHTPVFGDTPTGSGERSTWRDDKDDTTSRTSSLEEPGRQDADLDLSLPNIGLKDPEDITWPYGDEFTYDANLSDLMPMSMDMNFKTNIDCINEEYAGGGKMSDRIIMKFSQPGASVEGAMIFHAGYDENRRTTSLGMAMEMKIRSSIPLPMDFPDNIFSYEGRVEGDTLIEDFESAPMMGMEPSHSEREIPEDGFFFSAGTATPGLTAIMFSALDVEDGETATVWLINPLMFGPFPGESPSFIRANITKLSECERGIQDHWEDTRESADDYSPPDDVETYVIYEDKEDSDEFTEATFVYVDSNGRLIRMEEPGPGETIIVELQKIRQDRPWWGKERGKDE